MGESKSREKAMACWRGARDMMIDNDFSMLVISSAQYDLDLLRSSSSLMTKTISSATSFNDLEDGATIHDNCFHRCG